MRSLFIGIISLFICQLGYTDPLIPGTIGTSQTICYKSAPVRLSETASPSGGTGSYTRQWQSSTDNITWTNISGATRTNYPPPALTQNMYYRLNYTSGSETVPSIPVTITVLAEVIAGTIGSTQTICHGIIPGRLSEITSPSGGTGSFNRVWQSSTDNITWTNISGATRTNYPPPALTQSMYYRLNYTSGVCVANSAPVLITVSSEVTAGIIGTAQTICYNTIPVPLNQLNSPTGGNGNYTWQWQSSPDNITWTNITGATDPTFSPSALTKTTWFRRLVTSGACLSQSTPSVLISVNAELTSGIIGSAQTICYNSIPEPLNQLNSPTGGNGNYTWQWQSSPDNITWTNITGATLPTYSPLALTTSTWYRRLVTSGTCGAKSTAPILITVYPNLTAGTIGNDQTIFSGTIPGALTEMQAASGGSGSFSYQWQSSTDGTAFTNITNATSPGYAPPVLAADTWYRRQTTNAICGSITSNVVKISVNPHITLFTSEVPVTPDNNHQRQYDLGTKFEVLSDGLITKARLYASAFEGGAHQIRFWRLNDQGTYELIAGPIDWSFSSGIQGWKEINLASPIAVDAGRSYMISTTTGENLFARSDNFTPVSSNSYIRYLNSNYTPTIGNVPDQNMGDLNCFFRDIEYVHFSAGSAGAPASICYNTTPPTLSQITAPSGGYWGAYTYQWQNSTNGISWTNIAGATSPEFSPPALTVSTYYRRTALSGDFSAYSSPVLITVLPPIGSVQLHDNITIPFNTSTSFNVSISGGASPYTINYKINGIAQTAINNYISGTSIPTGALSTGEYTYTLISVTDANGCAALSLGTNITITATNNGNLTAGTVGPVQSICYNTIPSPLTQITAPSGGTGVYTFQWQSSNDNITWTDIPEATLSDYSPSAQIVINTYYRRTVISGSYLPVPGSSVLITVLPQITLAQLHDNITIENNTSTNFNVLISGGTSPFIINYSLDGIAQTAINNYINGASIPTGLLTTGTYVYSLTSVFDANGCTTQNLGSNINVTVKPVTLFTTEVPAEPDKNYSTQFDMGTRFEVISGGIITKVRLYTSASESGAHQIRFWRLNDQGTYELIAGPIDWSFSSGIQGWREVDLANPIAVDAGRSYMISITTGENFFARSDNFTPVSSNSYIRYLNSNYTPTIGNVPDQDMGYLNCFFRDIVFVPFSPGSAGVSTTICYNTAPPAFGQILAPSGGFGQPYSYQWQNSINGSTWENIPGATSSDYTPPVLTINTYFRRVVTSGGYSVYGTGFLIHVDPQFSSAQLGSNITVFENSSTSFNVSIYGGTPPYTVNYTRNGISQPSLTNYTSGTDIFTGVLSNGTYIYTLTSVVDAFGCSPGSLGSAITIGATLTETGTSSNKALIIVNSDELVWYPFFTTFIKPYFDWFGIPYDICDIRTTALPSFTDYAVIVFGHRDVYPPEGGYPITDLEAAIRGGVGLCSFDPHLFDFESSFNSPDPIGTPEVLSSSININPNHYITAYHANDLYNSTNNIINLKPDAAINIYACSYTLNNAEILATMSDGSNTVPLLQAATYGSGKIVKWSTHRWMRESYLGPVYGMDDLVWRSIVWAARKPFIMQGIPPMITMRVDDVNGQRSQGMPDLQWLKICNEHGLIPWMGLLINEMTQPMIDILRDRINNNLATAYPHAFGYNDFIFYNVNGLSPFNSGANVVAAWNFFSSNNLKVSNIVLPHWYTIDADAVNAIAAEGVEFIGNRIPVRSYPYVGTPGDWLKCGPYRLDGPLGIDGTHYTRDGTGDNGQPHFYAGFVDLEGHRFFNCLTEIGDDGGYEWYPNASDIQGTIARGVRHLRRALNGMFLPVLFTHENQMVMDPSTWNTILSGVTSGVASYNPVYRSTDYAALYLRAKEGIEITNVTDYPGIVNITCSGINDMETKCYLFTETGNEISYRLVTLPKVTSTSVPVIRAVSK